MSEVGRPRGMVATVAAVLAVPVAAPRELAAGPRPAVPVLAVWGGVATVPVVWGAPAGQGVVAGQGAVGGAATPAGVQMDPGGGTWP